MLLFVSVGILLGVVCLVRGGDVPCPSDISPCRCDRKSESEQLRIVCESVRHIDQLYPVLNKTKGLDVSFFFHGGVGHMPSELFQGHTSKHIMFYHANVRSFGSRPFSGLEDHLERLEIQGSVHNDLSLPLGHLNKLRYFKYLFNSRVLKLGNEWFSGGPRSLQSVRMMGNNFKEIGDQAFADLTSAEEILLTDNKFDKISRSMFPRPADKLEELDIGFNFIPNIAEGTFDDMPALKILSVSANRLTTLSEAVFGRIWGQLNEIYFYNNRGLKCDSRMAWILSRKSEMPSKTKGACAGDESLDEFLKKDPSDIVDIEEYH